MAGWSGGALGDGVTACANGLIGAGATDGGVADTTCDVVMVDWTGCDTGAEATGVMIGRSFITSWTVRTTSSMPTCDLTR